MGSVERKAENESRAVILLHLKPVHLWNFQLLFKLIYVLYYLQPKHSNWYNTHPPSLIINLCIYVYEGLIDAGNNLEAI